MSKTIAAVVLMGLMGSAAAQAEQATVTGHVDLVSRYVLRGITSTYGPGAPLGNVGADGPESDRAALQWGADWVHPSGFYLGYFGSTINYSYKALGKSYSDRTVTDFQKDKSIENDFYGGYTGKAGDFSYTLGLTGYVYLNGKHANALETKLAAGYGPFTVSAQTLLDDVVWGNKGDTYWTLNFSQPLSYDGWPPRLNFTASLGYYTYEKEGKFLGSVDTLTGTACPAGQGFFTNGCLPSNRPVSGAFRHLILGVTQPIGESGFTWGLQGIIGGDNRFGVKQKNQVVATLTYGF